MINTRLAVAIHVLSLIASRPQDELTSDYIASSVNTNPVVIRRIVSMLKKSGLVKTRIGVAGTSLAKEPSDISLLDVYQAVEPNEELFAIHEKPNQHCPIGKGIQAVLDEAFHEAQAALEAKLASQSIQDILDHLFA